MLSLINLTFKSRQNPEGSCEYNRCMSLEQTELEGLRALDTRVIAAIHNQYFPELFRYARYRLGDESLAEDIAGETLTRLLEAVHAGRGPTSSLRGWLVGTASHLISDHLRQIYTHPTEALPDEPDQAQHPFFLSQHMEGSERQHAVQQALSQLTPEQQQVISLRFGGGYSLEETAEVMNKKTNAIKALQFRALAALRRVIAEEIL